jgi:hypothetical protein
MSSEGSFGSLGRIGLRSSNAILEVEHRRYSGSQQKICFQVQEFIVCPEKCIQEIGTRSCFLHGEPSFTRSERNHCVYGTHYLGV